jgi:ribokinase
MTTPRVVVIGSVMVDRVVAVPAIVRPGETVAALGMAIHPGGKGANQAAAASRAGAETIFAGRTGRDGGFVLDALRRLGVDVSAAHVDEGASGTAFVQVDATGQNAIAIVPEANARFDARDLDRAVSSIRPGDLVLLQNETAQLDEVVGAVRERGGRPWLNVAPVDPRPSAATLAAVECLLVNESEAAALSGGESDPGEALRILCDETAGRLVVVTLGADGARAGRDDARWSQAAHEVEVLDTVGCGDAFIGAMAAWTVRGAPEGAALAAACAAGSLAATRRGAMPSMPDRAAIEALVAGA